jgi:hypothetical protein
VPVSVSACLSACVREREREREIEIEREREIKRVPWLRETSMVWIGRHDKRTDD